MDGAATGAEEDGHLPECSGLCTAPVIGVRFLVGAGVPNPDPAIAIAPTLAQRSKAKLSRASGVVTIC